MAIIHSFLTNGEPMFNFAKLFLKSLKHHNKEDIKVVFSSRDLSEDQINKLHQIYGNLNILNRPIDYNDLSLVTRKPISLLREVKSKVEARSTGIKDNDQLLGKQFISVEERYKKSITETMELYQEEKYMLHLDIDICFSGNVTPLFDIIKKNDISLKFRGVSGKNRKIVGYCVGININENSGDFMNTWIHHINRIPLVNKPKGYGQTTLGYAFKDLGNQISIGRIPAGMTAHERNYFKKEKRPILLSGNKGSKQGNIQKFEKIYKG